jgi:hypothetical protein
MLNSREAAFLFALGLATSVPLATAQDALTNIRQCAAESDDIRRLACYDKQFRVLDARSPSPPNAPVATPEGRFGMNGQVERSNPSTEVPKLDSLTAHITAVGYKPRGEAIIKLDNGQVWEETDGEDPITPKIGEEVTINAGVMGAYWLQSGKHGSVRVKRTR